MRTCRWETLVAPTPSRSPRHAQPGCATTSTNAKMGIEQTNPPASRRSGYPATAGF